MHRDEHEGHEEEQEVIREMEITFWVMAQYQKNPSKPVVIFMCFVV